MNPSARHVAILGGNRIRFARSNTAYAEIGNQDMLTAALKGLVERFNLRGEQIGEVAAGAVIKHSRDCRPTTTCAPIRASKRWRSCARPTTAVPLAR